MKYTDMSKQTIEIIRAPEGWLEIGIWTGATKKGGVYVDAADIPEFLNRLTALSGLSDSERGTFED